MKYKEDKVEQVERILYWAKVTAKKPFKIVFKED